MNKINLIIYVNDIRSVKNAALTDTLSALDEKLCITIVDDTCSEEESLILKNYIPESNKSITYVKNNSFLGFSKSCNSVIRAYNDDNDVLVMTGGYHLTLDNVDELYKVLYASEHNGAVIPRSNSGYFSRYPFINNINEEPENVEVSRRCFINTNRYLKDFNIVPYPDNTLILFKKILLDNWGLFSEILNSPSVAIRAICEDINKPGFSTVLANHTFVPNYSVYVNPYDEQDKLVLYKCYAYIDKVSGAYEDMAGFYNDFTRVLDPEYYSRKRVLLVLMDKPQDVSHLAYVDKIIDELKDCDVTLLTTEELDMELSLTAKYKNVQYYSNLEGQFHAGIILMEKFFPEMFYIVSKVCMKMAVAYYDKSVLDSSINDLYQALYYRIQKIIFRVADMTIFEDRSFYEDLEMIFGNNKKESNKRVFVNKNYPESMAAATRELLDEPINKDRIQQISIVQRYIWSAISGLNNFRAKYSEQHNILNNMNNIIRSSADDKTKLEELSKLRMES